MGININAKALRAFKDLVEMAETLKYSVERLEQMGDQKELLGYARRELALTNRAINEVIKRFE